MIYLDNAATTRQKPQPVIDAVVSAMTTLGNSARGTHEGSLSASRMIYGTREKLATFFNCPRPDHVVFTANSTEALNMAICGLLDPGDHVIATDLEHNSVLRPLYRLEAERSVSLSFVPADRQGRIDYGEFGRLIRPETRAIICTHASNLTGNAVDIGRVGAIAHAHGLIFLVDASQTAGVLPIDMEAQQIDLLCFTGHKSLMGPQGTGGLCLGENVALRPWKVGGTGVQTYNPAQPEQLPTRLEAGTLNGHGIAGLSASLDYIRAVGMETIREKEEALMRRFYEGVSAIPGVFYRSPDGGGGAEYPGLRFRRSVGRAGAGLRHCHPPRCPLCPPDAPGLGHGASGSRAVQLRLVQHGGGNTGRHCGSQERCRMIEKKRWLLITFHTTSEAMAMEQRCQEAGLAGRLIPVPRTITADCGLAWRAELSLRPQLEALTQSMDVAGYYELEL